MASVLRNGLAVLAGWALAGAPGQIVFAPEAGTVLTRSWSEALELEVDSLDETLGGGPVNMPFDVIELEIARAFTLEDELTASAGGRPIDLTRSFGSSSLGFSIQLDGEPVGKCTGAAACDDGVVRFIFDAEEESYAREWLEGDKPDLLEGFDPDLDLLGLLPGGEVEIDDTWEPDPEALRSFFAAGGDLDFKPLEAVIEMAGAPPELLIAGALGGLHEVFTRADSIDGKVEARFIGTEEGEGGAELARLELELDIEAEADLGPRFRGIFRGDVDRTSHDFQLGAEVDGTLEILWDLTGGHLRSASFAGDVGLNGHLVFPATIRGEIVTFVGDYEMFGEGTVELTVE